MRCNFCKSTKTLTIANDNYEISFENIGVFGHKNSDDVFISSKDDIKTFEYNLKIIDLKENEIRIEEKIEGSNTLTTFREFCKEVKKTFSLELGGSVGGGRVYSNILNNYAHPVKDAIEFVYEKMSSRKDCNTLEFWVFPKEGSSVQVNLELNIYDYLDLNDKIFETLYNVLIYRENTCTKDFIKHSKNVYKIISNDKGDDVLVVEKDKIHFPTLFTNEYSIDIAYVDDNGMMDVLSEASISLIGKNPNSILCEECGIAYKIPLDKILSIRVSPIFMEPDKYKKDVIEEFADNFVDNFINKFEKIKKDFEILNDGLLLNKYGDFLKERYVSMYCEELIEDSSYIEVLKLIIKTIKEKSKD